ncbi:MAG TPA: FAD-binding oxidoreductase [Patescibacteria group bacterium]|nr:FAD-binding oxidoreductase [Patescibacteria group bacterium]
MTDFSQIKTQIKGEVLTDKETLARYSRDASIFEIEPACVVRPQNSADVQALVKWAAAQKHNHSELSLTARSAGTDMSGGALNDSVIVDFAAHFSSIIDIHGERAGGGAATVQPGVFYRDFERASLAQGLILPCYTASKSLNTLGGMIANNSAGEKSLSYGQTKDYVLQLKAVLSDGNEYTFGELDEAALEQKLKLPGREGEIYRRIFRLIKDNYETIMQAKPTTSKNSAGYLLWEVWRDKKTFNLARLLTGAQGTLGLVTELSVRLVRPRPQSGLLVIFMNDLARLGEVVKTVAEFKPESFESYDDHTFKLAMKFFPDMLKRMKGNLFALGLKFLPEMWMTLTGGIPKLILIAEFTGETAAEVAAQAARAQEAVRAGFGLKTHLTASAAEAEKYWVVRRESFNLLRQHTHGLATAPFIDDIVVHPAELPKFLPELNAILADYPSLIYTIAGHAGDANFHIIPLMDLSRPDQRAIIPKLADRVYDLVLKYHGSLTAEHNDGLIRSPYLAKMYGPKVTELFAEVKRIFDPDNLFNPRKKTGASLEYSLAHIKTTL